MCPRSGSLSLHFVQFCPLLLNVCVESLSFNKTEEGQASYGQGPDYFLLKTAIFTVSMFLLLAA